MAAAAAMAALDNLLICIFDSSIVLERSGIAARIKDPANALIITQLSKLMPVSIGRQRASTAAKRSLLNDGFLMLIETCQCYGEAAMISAWRTGSNLPAACSSQSSPRRISAP